MKPVLTKVLTRGLTIAALLLGPTTATGQGDTMPTLGIVSDSECQAEFQAVLADNLETPGSSSPAQLELRLRLATYNNGGTPRRLQSIGLPADELRSRMALAERQAAGGDPECDESCRLQARLDNCLWKTSINRGNGAAPPPAPSRAATAPDDEAPAEACSESDAAKLNRELGDIDQQISRFLASPAGNDMSVTPKMQVVMWGTDQQARLIERYCLKAPAFQQRHKELKASYAGAEQACRQVQSSPDACRPVAPDKLSGG